MNDITEAIEKAIGDSMPFPDLILSAVSYAVEQSMPPASQVRTAMTVWSPLPPGSHLRVDSDGRFVRGADVVAVRSVRIDTLNTDEHGQVMTASGAVVALGAGAVLVVGDE